MSDSPNAGVPPCQGISLKSTSCKLDLTCDSAVADMENIFYLFLANKIRKAMFSIGDNKAPGLDGYSAAFFNEAWNIVGTDVTKAIKEFFTNGVLLKELNHT
ncbi:hypothetical protein Tco_0070043, partial [Tanacetum coccineum]